MDEKHDDKTIREAEEAIFEDPPVKGMRSPLFRIQENTSDTADLPMEDPEISKDLTEPDPDLPEGEETEEVEEEEAEEETVEEADNKLKRFWRSKTMSRILIGLSLVFFALGIYFFVKPMIIHRNQDKIAQELLDRLKDQTPDSTEEITIEVDTKDINLPGSYRDENDYILPPGLSRPKKTETEETTSPSKAPSVVTIRTDAIMRIPKINLEIAIAPDVTASSLWVLPGHYPSSPQPGDIGVSAYFGHRMYGRGRHFNRLNEIEPGDKIQVQRKGQLYNFIVESSDIIEPADLGKYVFESADKSRILLVTCHPIQTTGIPQYRIVVRGYLESSESVG